MDREDIILAGVFLIMVLLFVASLLHQASSSVKFVEKCAELGGEAVHNGKDYQCLGAKHPKDNK
jgi:hypothetical protein